MTLKPTHLDDSGAAHMVDVGAKPATQRRAVAGGRITMSADALEAVRTGNAPKGDILSTARIAGIMAAKRTADLIPLCHPLALSHVGVDFAWEAGGITVTATAATSGPTGVEMEALTAASVALLTLYDMAKALDRAMVLGTSACSKKAAGARATGAPDDRAAAGRGRAGALAGAAGSAGFRKYYFFRKSWSLYFRRRHRPTRSACGPFVGDGRLCDPF